MFAHDQSDRALPAGQPRRTPLTDHYERDVIVIVPQFRSTLVSRSVLAAHIVLGVASVQMAQMMDSGEDHAHSGEMSNAVTIHAGARQRN